jgi:hypothetical protein
MPTFATADAARAQTPLENSQSCIYFVPNRFWSSA